MPRTDRNSKEFMSRINKLNKKSLGQELLCAMIQSKHFQHDIKEPRVLN